VFLILLCLSACQSSVNINTSNQLKSFDSTPSEVKDFVKRNFPAWTFPDTTDYRLWWAFYDRGALPSCVLIDVNNDNIDDYGIVLKSQKSIKLIILIGTGNGFSPWIAEDFNGSVTELSNDIPYGLISIPPQQIDCVVDNNPTSLILKSNGLSLMEYEKQIKIYYWDDLNIKVFRIR
jgi:hypothetical protein